MERVMPEILFFPYFGPNRHSDKRVVECRLNFGHEKNKEFPQQASDIHDLLIENGMLDSTEKFPQESVGDNRIDWYSSLFAQTALLFQYNNGHRVGFYSVSSDALKKRSIALIEYEDSETAMAAIKLTVAVFSGKSSDLQKSYRQFSGLAHDRKLSSETEAIINNARRREIPLFQLDRAPLTGCIDTGFRVRRNGFLSLGQGANSLILDGTFCVSRAGDYLKALLRNPAQRIALIKQLGIPFLDAGAAGENNNGLLHLLAINGNITAIEQSKEGARRIVKDVHESLTRQVLSIEEKLGFTPIVVQYKVLDASRPLTESSAVAIGFELAPDLGELFGSCPSSADCLDAAAADLIDWLYPLATDARIPVVAVTGTNGKTTTSRMIRHIFDKDGFKTGLVCTDGIFLGQRQVSRQDNSTFMGHARVLINQQVNAAVLETHHRGIAVHGFAFQKCDVAICLNVTEEHLAEGEIESVEEMTLIKRALVERAGHTAILFADDDNCAGMIKHMSSEQICLVSMQSDIEQLRALAGDKLASFCILETVGDRQWIVIHRDQKRLPMMPVNDIPATFNGTARFNVSNAMHAIAASYYSGVEIRSIRSALSGFSASQQFTPGRMNVFDGLPFRVIMDFAHNPDGIKKLCEFADLQQVTGRKVIAFCGLAKRTDEINRKIAKTVAGHFDYYYCKDYEPSKPPKLRFMAPFMQKVLIEEGVPTGDTSVLTFGQDVTFKILNSCRPGDMLFFLVGHSESIKFPAYVQAYKERLAIRASAKSRARPG
jgi:UDP-N-acetylmuramyl tripeptide synthase